MIEPIHPSVLIDGHTYYPPCRLYILAMAWRGVEWAVEAIEADPLFHERLRRDLYNEGFVDGDGI